MHLATAVSGLKHETIPLELGVAQLGVIRFTEGGEKRGKGCMRMMGEGCGIHGLVIREMVTGGRRILM